VGDESKTTPLLRSGRATAGTYGLDTEPMSASRHMPIQPLSEGNEPRLLKQPVKPPVQDGLHPSARAASLTTSARAALTLSELDFNRSLRYGLTSFLRKQNSLPSNQNPHGQIRDALNRAGSVSNQLLTSPLTRQTANLGELREQGQTMLSNFAPI
jgi:hypothetical protein